MRVRVINWIVILLLFAGCAQALTPISPTPARTLAPINSPPPALAVAPTLTATAAETWSEYQIAFASVRDITPGIYVTDLCGRSVHLITQRPMEANHPAWSSDGTRLAFTAKQGTHHELFVVDVTGTNLVQRLTDTNVREEKPAWSQDGARIAFIFTRDGNAEVYIMNADGSNPMRLTDHPANDANPAWSPDGKQIAFNSTRSTGKFAIYLMTADGSNVRSLLAGAAWFEKPAWSSDGKLIAFYSTRDGNAEVYVMNADGTDIRRITTQAGWDGQPSWSPQPFETSRPLLYPVTQPNGSRPLGEKASSE